MQRILYFSFIISAVLLFSPASFSQSAAAETTPFACGTSDENLRPEVRQWMQQSKTMAAQARLTDEPRLNCRVAVDIDSDTYKTFEGDENRIRREVLKMMASVSRLYEAELNIQLSVTNIHIHTDATTDPYFGKTDIFELLDITYKQKQKIANFPQPFDLLVYLPTKQFTGAGGVAYLNGQASVSPWGAIKTIAHEFGHNLGSAHTQSCSWEGGPLDYCYPAEGSCYDGLLQSQVGTIMSYCSYNSYTFHPQVRVVIRRWASTQLTPVTTVPDMLTLPDSLRNSRNFPYVFFTPSAKANYYVTQVSTTPDFSENNTTDTTRTPSIYLPDLHPGTVYYGRVRAVNAFGESRWSSSTVIVTANAALPTPTLLTPNQPISFAYNDPVALNFLPVPQAEFYEIQLTYQYWSYSPANDLTLKRTTTIPHILNASDQFYSGTFKWRVRAGRGNERSSWSDFQTAVQQPSSSNYSLSYTSLQNLPTDFKLFFYQEPDFIRQKVEIRETTRPDSLVFSYTFPPNTYSKNINPTTYIQGLRPNTAYQSTVKREYYLDDYYNDIPAGFSQSDTKTLSIGSEASDPDITFFTPQNAPTAGNRVLSTPVVTPDYLFYFNEGGISRVHLQTDSVDIFTLKNTNGLMSNQGTMATDSQRRLWVLSRDSKRKNYDGAFPLPNYSLRVIDSQGMNLVQAYDFPFSNVYPFDAENRRFIKKVNRQWEIYELRENNFEQIGVFQALPGSNSETPVKLTPHYLWIYFENNTDNVRGIRRIALNSGNQQIISRIEYPDIFNAYFNSNGFAISPQEVLAITNSTQKNIYLLEAEDNATLTDTRLPYQSGYVQSITFDAFGTLNVLQGYSNQMRIYRRIAGEWMLQKTLPNTLLNEGNIVADNRGTVWNYGNALTKFKVCPPTNPPVIQLLNPEINGESTQLKAVGCTNTVWNYTAENIGFTEKMVSGNHIALASVPGATYSVRCYENGCSSAEATGVIGGQAIAVKAVSQAAVCPGDSLWVYPELLGAFNENNTISVSLSTQFNAAQTLDAVVVGDSVRVKIPADFAADSTARLVVSSSSPVVSSQPYSLIIHPRPAVGIMADSVLCRNGSVWLAAAVADTTGLTYRWTDSTQNAALSTMSRYEATAAGVYRLSVKNAVGCDNAATKRLINNPKDPQVTISGQPYICEDSTTTLAMIIDAQQPFTFQWKDPQDKLLSDSLTAVVLNEAGTYRAAVMDAYGCMAAADVKVAKVLLSGLSIEYSGTPDFTLLNTPVLSVPPAANRSFQWLKDGLPLSNETANALTVKATGQYAVKVTESGCVFETAPVDLRLILGKENPAAAAVIVFPNPGQQFITIQNRFAPKAALKRYRIYSISGQSVLRWESAEESSRVDISRLSAGRYIIEVNYDVTTHQAAFIKQ